jgi:hypothetical protein
VVIKVNIRESISIMVMVVLVGNIVDIREMNSNIMVSLVKVVEEVIRENNSMSNLVEKEVKDSIESIMNSKREKI